MFVLTTAAKDAIVQIQQDRHELMPMITWVTDSSQQNGRWELAGFIDKADPGIQALRRQEGAQFLFEISGIEFVIDGPMHFFELIKGATLDYVDGTFALK